MDHQRIQWVLGLEVGTVQPEEPRRNLNSLQEKMLSCTLKPVFQQDNSRQSDEACRPHGMRSTPSDEACPPHGIRSTPSDEAQLRTRYACCLQQD
ncbi:hypothetical protein NQZ68_014165 [Dissostichus eleginoides]|nr:hypothetical protein NQZ68_014165 [Dissostichus eleginoides]